jgi:formylglycine-generating enzyme
VRSIVLALVLLPACSVDANIARFPLEIVPNDAGDDAEVSVDTSTRCPQKEGAPVMIDLGAFCMDATEVTRAQYAAFLADGPTNIPGATCAWNDDLAPKLNPALPAGCTAEKIDLTTNGAHPVVCVDWCDAAAYCAWAGKRLCGAIGGGSQPFRDLLSWNDPNRDQWFAACAGDARRTFSYGDAPMPGFCNDAANWTAGDTPTTTEVATMLNCHGPPGSAEAAVYDLTGNVYEWVDSCQFSAGDPQLESCLIRGGHFADSEDHLSCAANEGFIVTWARTHFDDHIGIRCCAR